jgi:uncharacterized protein (TIGR00255 family)
MTGYGAVPVATASARGSVSVRAVNHRFLDVSVHLSRRLAALEPEIKQAVQRQVARGRVEVSVQAAPVDEGQAAAVAVGRHVPALVAALRAVQREHGLAGEVGVSDVARFPGALEVADDAVDVGDACRADVLAAVERALAGVSAMRAAEGRTLAEELRAAFARIEEGASRVEAQSGEGKAARRAALVEKIRALAADVGLDDAKVYQEAARAAERHDVAEEVQRLRSHLAQARTALDAGEPCGKRLDFLAQEMAREVNTVGNKAATAGVVHEVVALKEEIERVREQVQNVE